MDSSVEPVRRSPVAVAFACVILSTFTVFFAVSAVLGITEYVRATHKEFGVVITSVTKPGSSNGRTCIAYTPKPTDRAAPHCFAEVDDPDVAQGSKVDLFWSDGSTLHVMRRWQWFLPLFGLAGLTYGWWYILSGRPMPPRFT